MAKAKKNNAHPLFKLGKAKAKRDKRNLMLAAIMRAPVSLPAEYDFDLNNTDIPTPMFVNDTLGDCVIAGRAHQTLRFEKAEQGIVLHIIDGDVTREYFKETGGADTGLVVLDSLKLWRKVGWSAAKKRYKIKAFAQIDQTDHTEMKRAIFMDLGVGLGFSLPNNAFPQIQAGKMWEVTTGAGSAPNPKNGHYVYCSGYTSLGPVCVTWGRKQQITWAFVDKYCDEAYGIIDAIKTKKKRSGLNEKALDHFLAAL